MEFLFFLYRLVFIVLFLFLSAVLLYHRKVARWVTFSLGFLLVYVAGSMIFFDSVDFSIDIVPYLRPAVLLGMVALFGYGLVQGWTVDEILGFEILFLVLFIAFLIVLFSIESGRPVYEVAGDLVSWIPGINQWIQ